MYKNVKFNYSQLVDILSAGGEIVLKNINNEVLYVLNKDNVKSADDCTVNLQVEEVIVEINGVKRNGTIDFEFTKASGKANLDKKTFVKIDSVESKIKATAKYIGLEEEIILEEASTVKYFEETKTNATLKINKDSLATIKSNGNVEFKIELNNNVLTSDLYVNPSFEITLTAKQLYKIVKAIQDKVNEQTRLEGSYSKIDSSDVAKIMPASELLAVKKLTVEDLHKSAFIKERFGKKNGKPGPYSLIINKSNSLPSFL